MPQQATSFAKTRHIQHLQPPAPKWEFIRNEWKKNISIMMFSSNRPQKRLLKKNNNIE